MPAAFKTCAGPMQDTCSNCGEAIGPALRDYWSACVLGAEDSKPMEVLWGFAFGWYTGQAVGFDQVASTAVVEQQFLQRWGAGGECWLS